MQGTKRVFVHEIHGAKSTRVERSPCKRLKVSLSLQKRRERKRNYVVYTFTHCARVTLTTKIGGRSSFDQGLTNCGRQRHTPKRVKHHTRHDTSK